MTRCVGVDLGTTYSAVAYVNDLGKPEVITNREGERITPSVVLFQDEEPLVGSMAKRAAATAPLDTVQFVKRAVGDPAWKFVTETGTEYRPEEISALILKRLIADAELALGEGTITDAVITVPAYFDDARRRATMDAGKIAGLEVRRVLNEPTAAALAYGVEDLSGGTLLVYDLGGGTFDVTVMRVEDGTFDVLATGGDPNLGGFDWDNALMTWLNEQFMAAGGQDLLDDESTEADLRERAELAKRALTSVARTNVSLGAGGFNHTVALTREQFDDLTVGLLGRTRHHLIEVTDAAALAFSAIDKLLLVGGSTRMPQVRAMVEQVTGHKAERSINPDEVVALGAAVQAALLPVGSSRPELPELATGGVPISISDVTSQSLGVIALDHAGQRSNSVIIPHNSKVPTKRSELYATVADQQPTIHVEVTEGDDEEVDYVRIVGGKEIPLPPYPSGAPIEIAFAYDIDQTVFVEVHDRTADMLLGSFDIDRIANMSDREVEAGKQRLRELEVG